MTEHSTHADLVQQVNDLNESIKIYQALVNNSPDLIYRTDLQGRVTYVSPSIYKLTGFTAEEVIGKDMAQDGYVVPEERNIFLKKLQENGQVTNFQAQIKHKDGFVWWASTNAHFLKDKDGNIIGVEGISRDITELKAAEEALLKSEERFRLAFHTSPDAITLSRASDSMIIDINEGFIKLMGYKREEVVGKTSFDLNIWKNFADRKRMVDEVSKKGCVENLEAEFIDKDGQTRTGLMSARFLKIDEEDYILSITRDITEHKKLEQQLHQAQKFQAVGTLAGGIAHNFNNLLMGIQGHAVLIGSDLPPGHHLCDRVQGIDDCVKSAAHLAEQLLGLARGGKYEIKAIDINELLHNSANMFGHTRKEIQIHTKLRHEQIVVDIDKNQIEQVLLNMFVNAWQAMPDGGNLFLETSVVSLDEMCCQPRQIDPGQYCMISIADTGIGMDEQTRLRVFDPFFTTKESARGTGLGLASAYGIVKNHGGMIDVFSEINSGATFNIYLPVSSRKIKQNNVINQEIVKGSETILLVDDELRILEVARPMLEALGYNVLAAINGKEATDLVERHGNAIDLVLLDLIMPEMDGGKTFDQIRILQPDMFVILASGYSLNGQASDIMNRGCNGFIQKPFNLSSLSQKIRQVLDAG